MSALRGPGTHTRDPIHPDVSDIAGRRAVHRRKADIGTKVGARESLEKVGRTSLGNAGSTVDDKVFVQAAAGRMRGYGAAETVDHTEVALPGALRQAHPDGIDVLIDLVSDADGFAALAALVQPGGTAVTTKYVADPGALAAAGVTGDNFNFAQHVSDELLEQVADALVGGRIAAPPITRITLEQALAALNPAQAGRADGKTVITL